MFSSLGFRDMIINLQSLFLLRITLDPTPNIAFDDHEPISLVSFIDKRFLSSSKNILSPNPSIRNGMMMLTQN